MPTDDPIRKFVKPAVAGARIPDPAHRGLYLAAEGTEVTWDHSWILRERRGEIVVIEQAKPASETKQVPPAPTVEVAAEAKDPAAPEASPTEPASPAEASAESVKPAAQAG